jgi:hypothetical protein
MYTSDTDHIYITLLPFALQVGIFSGLKVFLVWFPKRCCHDMLRNFQNELIMVFYIPACGTKYLRVFKSKVKTTIELET